MSIIPIVFGGGAILIGLFFIWKSMSAPKKIAEIQNEWDVVSGELQKVEYISTGADKGHDYVFDVEYEYDIDGKIGTTVYPPILGSHSTHRKEEVEAFVNEYAEGDEVEVYMNPENKEETCLACVDISKSAEGTGKAKAIGAFFILSGFLFISAGF